MKLPKPRLIAATLACVVLSGVLILAVPHVLPSALSQYRPDIAFSVPTGKKEIFLTIDDVPSPSTSGILAVLKKHHVPATFFVIADQVTAPEQLEEIVRAGHSLGNHLQTTKACSKLSLTEFQSSFDRCAAVIGVHGTPGLFRPASDFGTREQIAYARAKGYQSVMGTVFPLDHWITDPVSLRRLVHWLAVPGGIMIMHDGATRGRTTSAVLDRIIPELQAAGFSFGRFDASTLAAASK